jgi:hypothetical protein
MCLGADEQTGTVPASRQMVVECEAWLFLSTIAKPRISSGGMHGLAFATSNRSGNRPTPKPKSFFYNNLQKTAFLLLTEIRQPCYKCVRH